MGHDTDSTDLELAAGTLAQENNFGFSDHDSVKSLACKQQLASKGLAIICQEESGDDKWNTGALFPQPV